MLADRHRRAPDVVLDVDFSGRLVGLIDAAFDLALHATPQDRLDAGLVVRELMTVSVHLFGTPADLDAMGGPDGIDDPNGRSPLVYGGLNAGGNASINGASRRKTVKFDTVPRHAVDPSGTYVSAKVRTFIDFLVEKGRRAAAPMQVGQGGDRS